MIGEQILCLRDGLMRIVAAGEAFAFSVDNDSAKEKDIAQISMLKASREVEG